MGVIYTLSDPRDDEVRFVGKGFGPRVRDSVFYNEYDGSPKSIWMCILTAKGLVPVFAIVHETTEETVDADHAACIARFRAAGADLLNETRADLRRKIGRRATERLALAWEMDHS